jgi:hypothetical protein
MARKLYSPNTATSPRAATEKNQTGVQASELGNVIGKVKALLQEECPEKGLDVIARSRLKSPWITNAAGVCQLRLGNVKQAIAAFQSLAVHSTVVLKSDAPTVFKTNYAVALLASGNLAGCLSVLHEIDEEEDFTVQRLRAAIQRWKRSLSLWERLRWFFGDEPQRQITLDFPLGDLERPGS